MVAPLAVLPATPWIAAAPAAAARPVPPQRRGMWPGNVCCRRSSCISQLLLGSSLQCPIHGTSGYILPVGWN